MSVELLLLDRPGGYSVFRSSQALKKGCCFPESQMKMMDMPLVTEWHVYRGLGFHSAPKLPKNKPFLGEFRHASLVATVSL